MKKMALWFVIYSAFLAMPGCNPARQQEESRTLEIAQSDLKQASKEAVECWFDLPKRAVSVNCFYIHVPQNYENREGQWIKFSLVAISSNPEETLNPILHLGGGGPGNPMGFWPDEEVAWIFDRYQGLAIDSGRDLYIIDPRGVGYTNPSLGCFEFADYIETVLGEVLTIEQENAQALAVYEQCRTRLENQGVDFSYYNSATVAQDMEQMRQLLGVDQWNLYGVSYGTRYAQVMARDFPDSVESMILDAATFPDVNYTERSADDYLQTLNRLFDYCKQEISCHGQIGDVQKVFWELVEKLNESPLEYQIYHPFKSRWMDISINGTRFLNAYYNALYSAEYYAVLPNIIDSLNNGDLGEFENALYEWLNFILDADYADAAAIAHYCHEEAPFVDLSKAMINLETLPEPIRNISKSDLQSTFDQCRDWKIQPATDIESKPVVTDIPTLFLHGALDPVLPVKDLQEKSATFSQSDQVVFDDISHSIVGIHPCGLEIARQFYQHKLEFRDSLNCEI